jgi:hypothetical protein
MPSACEPRIGRTLTGRKDDEVRRRSDGEVAEEALMAIEEERIERRLGYPQSCIQSAWTSDLAEVEALAERLRLELMLSRLDPATKAFYRAAAHFLDEALDQLHEKAGA